MALNPTNGQQHWYNKLGISPKQNGKVMTAVQITFCLATAVALGALLSLAARLVSTVQLEQPQPPLPPGWPIRRP
ncbi:MAG: hypothetical protein KR126chlam2_00856 [Chlamydiae bacterium]|nr:hypothetical protein [Chlamydiota bacterium]